MSEESLTETDGLFSRCCTASLEVYNMKNRRRGLALIFNYEQFDPDLQMNPRFGSNTDCTNLERSLKGLGFDVRVFKDYKKSEVNSELDKAAKEDHSNADCLLVVYMSYGTHDKVVKSEDNHEGSDEDDDEDNKKGEGDACNTEDNVYAYDGKLPMKTITDKFKGTECNTLVRKPKIFIWQVCCENEEEAHDAMMKRKTLAGPASVQTIPAAADFIMCYAVAKGSFSHRHKDKGSWYIQDLCTILEKYGNSLEFTRLLTLVNREVAKREDRTITNQGIKTKQIPCFASMLTKKLYFQTK